MDKIPNIDISWSEWHSFSSVSLHFARGEMVILGTLYAGEMKKGIFTVMHCMLCECACCAQQ